MRKDIENAKKKLDTHISKQRTHMYKPIQIAEILRMHRNGSVDDLDLDNLNTYRTKSRKWRDSVTMRLVGRVSTSSARFQDNLFENNAIPPKVISVLAKENEEKNGVVESYIYHRFKERLEMVHIVNEFIMKKNHENFRLKDFLEVFGEQKGLSKSVDKVYEIIVYSLFYTIINHLDVEIEMSFKNPNSELMTDFKEFNSIVFGVSEESISTTIKANIYRVGVTNAADKGLDMWSNFGPVIQVKHLTLTEELSEEIADSIKAEQIVIVCKKAEHKMIESLLTQIGWRNKIQGIVTEDDLITWYDLCFIKYSRTLGINLIENLRREFAEEFPSTVEIDNFLSERGYAEKQLRGLWTLN